MSIFGFLQFDPVGIKRHLGELGSTWGKLRYIGFIIMQLTLASVFCMAFIMLFSTAFGPENSIVGLAVLLCIQLVRVSDFGMRRSHGAWAIIALFAIFAAGPKTVNLLEPGWAFAANAGFIFIIVLIGCHNTSAYNQVVLVLSYLLLTGLDVSGRQFDMRLAALAMGAALTISVYWLRRRKPGEESGEFISVFRKFRMSSQRTRWQIRFALGVAGSLLISSLLDWDKPVWAGISTMSVMMPVQAQIKKCLKDRVVWNVSCCAFFLVLYALIPIESYDVFSILSGMGLGFTASFLWESILSTVLAAFAMPAYELPVAVIARALNNLLGASFGWVSGKAMDGVLRRFRTIR